MTSKGIILVGGPADGTKVVVPSNSTMYHVRSLSKPIFLSPQNSSVSIDDVEFKLGIYKAGKDRQVFEWEGWAE